VLTFCELLLLPLQAKEHLFSMLVWHERLLYAENCEGHAAVQQLSERISKLGTGLRQLLGRKQ
jgi:hypothetical protein